MRKPSMLHETPNMSHNTSSFLVSPSQGYCQIQAELWLTWVTSKCTVAGKSQTTGLLHSAISNCNQYVLLKMEIFNGEAMANINYN